MNDWYEQAVTGGIQREWIDETDSDRRLLALSEVNERIKNLDPETDKAMPPLVIFSPRLCAGSHMPAEVPTKFHFIYLPPLLEYETNEHCTFIVAHEIAHAVLSARGCRKGEEKDNEEVKELEKVV